MGQTIVEVSFAPVEGKAHTHEPEMRNKKKASRIAPVEGKGLS
jgi:hypothetical protein